MAQPLAAISLRLLEEAVAEAGVRIVRIAEPLPGPFLAVVRTE